MQKLVILSLLLVNMPLKAMNFKFNPDTHDLICRPDGTIYWAIKENDRDNTWKVITEIGNTNTPFFSDNKPCENNNKLISDLDTSIFFEFSINTSNNNMINEENKFVPSGYKTENKKRTIDTPSGQQQDPTSEVKLTDRNPSRTKQKQKRLKLEKEKETLTLTHKELTEKEIECSAKNEVLKEEFKNLKELILSTKNLFEYWQTCHPQNDQNK